MDATRGKRRLAPRRPPVRNTTKVWKRKGRPMTEISRSALFGRLNPTALKAIETATGFCKMRGNPYVELVHWIHILLQDARNDLAAIRTAFGVDDTKLARDVVEALDSLPRGATAIS